MKIGFTGTQKGMDLFQGCQLALLIAALQPDEFHHGDCIGADEQAHGVVRAWRQGCCIVGHPPIDDRKRAFCSFNNEREPNAYLARNRYIVEACDLLIACPGEAQETIRSGTWSTVRYAENETDVPVLVVGPVRGVVVR